MQYLEAGQVAPLFRLQNQFGDWINLTDFKGKQRVVLYFYPKALTPGCTTQACGVRDASAQWQAVDAAVLGVSPDPLKKLLQFREKHELNFDLLSDPDHAVAEQYQVWGPKKFMGKDYVGIHRVTYVIGLDGRITHVLNKVNTKSHAQDVLALLG
jgi:peroxiredoxin Q/BCP